MDYERINLTTPDLYDQKLADLLDQVSIKESYPAKHIFSRPGERMNYIYFIKEGRTKHYMDNSEGGVKILYTLTPGWFFGETPCLLEDVTGLYSQTETSSMLYKIPEKEFKRLLAESELFRDKLLQCFAHKLLILRFEIANLTFNSCKSRLQRLFCASVDTKNITDPGWYNLKISYTQSELGEIVGGARVTISRQISELCNEGFLRIINRRAQVNIEKYDKFKKETNDSYLY